MRKVMKYAHGRRTNCRGDRKMGVGLAVALPGLQKSGKSCRNPRLSANALDTGRRIIKFVLWSTPKWQIENQFPYTNSSTTPGKMSSIYLDSIYVWVCALKLNKIKLNVYKIRLMLWQQPRAGGAAPAPFILLLCRWTDAVRDGEGESWSGMDFQTP